MINSAKGRLVAFDNKKNLELIGLIFEADGGDKENIIIHVHGNYGNFYNNKFIWKMSEKYLNCGVSFLTFNLSAHDGLCEGYRKGILDYVGGAVSDYSESILDIEAAVDFVKKVGYKKVTLQGHSLGCDKILEYVLNHNDIEKVILLSPVDSYAVQERWLGIHKNETVEEQLNRLRKLCKSENGILQWLDLNEYGAEGLNDDWIYKIPVTTKALLSILQGSAFKFIKLKNGEDFLVDKETYVFLGRNDGLRMCPLEEMVNFVNKHFTQCYVNDRMGCDHDIIGAEDALIDDIILWYKK